MKKGTSHWYARREQIEKLIEQGYGPVEIGRFLGLADKVIYQGFEVLGISLDYKRRPPPAPVAPQIECVYIDENGLKVIRYEARYAENALRQTTIIGRRR